ncbi:MAG: glycosyltransferase family 2 protein [Candidatus Magasanikbacteria bacterium]|nr:glycosyltransferase family 2 protein [Candidatus Magasanikbacteria bacterium]
MSSPLISIIIPVYNHYQELCETLESVFSQSIGAQNLEVIIVDDGSEKSAVNAFKIKILPNYPQIKFLEMEHKGAAAARNRGFQESAGEYVIFWDADLSAKKQMLQTLFEALKSHPEASYAYSSFYFGWKKFPSRQFDPAALRKCNFIHTSALIRRRDFPGFDENLQKFQDWDLWLTLLAQGQSGTFVPEFLFCVKPRRHGLSAWLPSFIYKLPWLPLPRLKKYLRWQKIVQKKHGLL